MLIHQHLNRKVSQNKDSILCNVINKFINESNFGLIRFMNSCIRKEVNCFQMPITLHESEANKPDLCETITEHSTINVDDTTIWSPSLSMR